MQIAPHPQYDRLRRLIAASHPGQRCYRRAYRCVELPWARPKYLVSGEGTRRFGGRWMRRGITEVVHAASTEALALKEARGAFAFYGIGRPRARPRVSVELEVRLEEMLDLAASPGVLGPFTIEEMLGEDWRSLNAGGRESLSQAAGRAAWECGFTGLVVPSARDRRARNLVWFPSNLSGGSVVEISGRTDLERWLAD